MIGKIDQEESVLETFAQTSDDPYDRHHYKVEFENGESIVIEDYEQLKFFWFQKLKDLNEVTVSVIDKKKKSNGGFK